MAYIQYQNVLFAQFYRLFKILQIVDESVLDWRGNDFLSKVRKTFKNIPSNSLKLVEQTFEGL